MSIMQKTAESHVKLAAPQLPAGIRSGGENVPLEFPHLYQIQAGDWRISYAVEHNRLAILVLEVLGADGTSSKDPVRENLNKKMKIKLLDWPEGTGSPEVPPEEISKKLKIKWLDLADEVGEAKAGSQHATLRIKLKGSANSELATRTSAGKSRITLLDSGEAIIDDQPEAEERRDEEPGDGGADPRVTPLDKPSM